MVSDFLLWQYIDLSPTLSPTFVIIQAGDKKDVVFNATEEKIISFMRDNPNITKPELVKLVGLGKTSIDNYIASLKKKGALERVGSNKKGYWRVIV